VSEPRPRGMAANAAITALAQVASMALGAVIALVILLRFGKDAETDGLFAAYGVYGVLVVVAQSFRTTIVARLTEDGAPFAALDRYLGAVGVLFVAAAIPLLALADPLARLLTGDLGPDAVHAARSSLEILWFASGAQLAGALLAAALAVRDEFALSGAAYVAGGLVSIAALLALAPAAGIRAVPLGLCAGGATTVALMLARLLRLGYRPSPAGMVPDRTAIGRAALLVWAAAGTLSTQLAFVVTLGFAARLGEGAPTLYTYATFLFGLFLSSTAGAMTIVLAPRLADTWDGRAESLRAPLVEVFRAGLTLITPIVGVVAVAGAAVASLPLDGHDARVLTDVVLAMSGGLVAAVALPVPLVALYTRGRYAAVAAIGLQGICLQFGLSALAVGFDSLVALGLASLVTGLAGALVVLLLVFGRGAWGVLATLGREVLRVAAVGALAFAPAGVAAALGGRVVQVLAALAGLAAFAALAPRALPRHWELAQRVMRPALARLRRRPVQPGVVPRA
jgi:peptidoglycan biosynthesis protein MviN/MurJ (putative lipid II flippase)